MEFHFFKKLENYFSTVPTAAFFRGGMTYSREAGLEPRFTDSRSSAHSVQYYSQAHPEMWVCSLRGESGMRTRGDRQQCGGGAARLMLPTQSGSRNVVSRGGGRPEGRGWGPKIKVELRSLH